MKIISCAHTVCSEVWQRKIKPHPVSVSSRFFRHGLWTWWENSDRIEDVKAELLPSCTRLPKNSVWGEWKVLSIFIFLTPSLYFSVKPAAPSRSSNIHLLVPVNKYRISPPWGLFFRPLIVLKMEHFPGKSQSLLKGIAPHLPIYKALYLHISYCGC